MLGQRTHQLRGASPEFLEVVVTAGRGLAAESLRLQAECRNVLSAVPADVPVLVLKGAAVAQWLYPQASMREYSDLDLLWPSRIAVEEAAASLEVMGYAVQHHPGELGHELLCRRTLTGGMRIHLDMHWKLVNAPVFSDVFAFDELHEASIPLPALGPRARGLCAVHALVHACMHRAINLSAGIEDRLKWLYDVHLLGELLQQDEWDEMVSLADERRVSGVCLQGVIASMEQFGTAIPDQVLDRLGGASSRDRVDARRLLEWRHVQVANLEALPSWSVRARWVWQSLMPPTSYLEELYGPGKGRVALLMERGKRAWKRLIS